MCRESAAELSCLTLLCNTGSIRTQTCTSYLVFFSVFSFCTFMPLYFPLCSLALFHSCSLCSLCPIFSFCQSSFHLFSQSLPRVPADSLSFSLVCLRPALPIGCFYGYLNQCCCMIGSSGRDWAMLEV